MERRGGCDPGDAGTKSKASRHHARRLQQRRARRRAQRVQWRQRGTVGQRLRPLRRNVRASTARQSSPRCSVRAPHRLETRIATLDRHGTDPVSALPSLRSLCTPLSPHRTAPRRSSDAARHATPHVHPRRAAIRGGHSALHAAQEGRQVSHSSGERKERRREDAQSSASTRRDNAATAQPGARHRRDRRRASACLPRALVEGGDAVRSNSKAECGTLLLHSSACWIINSPRASLSAASVLRASAACCFSAPLRSSTLVFLLWRDRKSSAIESSTFWGNMACPQSKTDVSPLEAVCRSFSEKTKGCFAPATMLYENEHDLDLVARKSPAKQKIEESRLALRKKLRAGNGVTVLSIRQFVTYVAPVRFVPLSELTASFGADKGEVEWIEAKDLCKCDTAAALSLRAGAHRLSHAVCCAAELSLIRFCLSCASLSALHSRGSVQLRPRQHCHSARTSLRCR